MDSTHPLDLADEDGVAGLDRCRGQEARRLDILYNNAGATRFSPIPGPLCRLVYTIRNELDIVFLAPGAPGPTSSPAAAAAWC